MESLTLWSERMLGARLLLIKLQDAGVLLERGKDAQVYSNALYECLKDPYQMSKFLDGEEISFYDHQRDKKGKLTKCKATIK